MSAESPKSFPVVYDSELGLQYSFYSGYITIPEASVNSITALTGDVIATGPGSAAATITNLAFSKLAALPSADILVGSSGNVATVRTLSGDATLSNTGVLTLATVNGNVGSFTNANITVDGRGRITAASSGSAGSTPSIVDSSATHGGAAAEEVTVVGLLTTSTIWAVTQKTVGGANLPLVGWTNVINGSLNIIYSADMGVGAVVRVVFTP